MSKSMSELWRENKSKDAAIDMASILDGARILAQSLAPNTEVVYTGMSVAQTDRKKLFLSPTVLGDEHPVSGQKVDVFLGGAVHEIGHVLFSPDKIEYLRRLASSTYFPTPDDRRLFRDFVNVFEDVYIDHLMTGFPVYREYLARERQYNLGEFEPEVILTTLKEQCDRTDMLNAFIYFALLGGKPDINSMDSKNLDVLATLLNDAMNMSTGKLSKDTCIMDAWRKLCTLPAHIDHDKDDKFKQSQDTVLPTPGTSDAQQDDKKGTDKPEDKTSQDTPSDVKPDAGDEDDDDESDDKGNAKGEKEAGETPDDEEDDDDDQTDEETDESEDEGDSGEDGESEKVAGDGADDRADGQDDSGKTQAEQPATDDRPVWKPQDLANKLDNLVDDTTPIDDALAKDISRSIIEKRDDLTQLVAHLAGDSRHTILAYTPKENGQLATEARMTTSTAEEKLRRVLQEYKLRRTKDYHGLRDGRVSTSRLHRVAYGDTRVFKRRETPDEVDMAICLLLDLSASVHESRALLNQIVCSMSDALGKEKVEFIALGYSLAGSAYGHYDPQTGTSVAAPGGNVYIPRLYDKETGKVLLELDNEWGSTPGYEGIAAAIAQLLRFGGNKRKVLIHFTDGRPNSGNTMKIPELLADARKKGITDIHMCVPGTDDSTNLFPVIYGPQTYEVRNIQDLPEMIRKALREKLNENGG